MLSRSNLPERESAGRRERTVRGHVIRGRVVTFFQWVIGLAILGGLGWLVFRSTSGAGYANESIPTASETEVVIFDDLGWEVLTDELSQASRRLIEDVVAGLSSYSVSVERIVLPRGTLREFDLTLHGSPLVWRLSLDRPAEGQVADINHVLGQIVTGELVATEYIDVRTPGRAIYQ